MHFEVSGITVWPWLPPLAAFSISFFSSMGGVSGAFLLLPFQMSVLGYTAPSVSATNQLFNVIAIPSGVYRYVKEGRMVWPLTWLVIAGTLPGVFLGAIVRVNFLPDPTDFKIFAALVFLYIGGRLVIDLTIRRPAGAEKKTEQRLFQSGRRELQNVASVTSVIAFGPRRLEYEYQGARYQVSVPSLVGACLLIGIVGGIYGIGGGAIAAPILVSFFRLPVHTVAGAALMGTFITSVGGVAFYSAMSVPPDFKLGALFGVGGAVGMYLGARCQKFVPARWIKWMLSVIILLTALRYLWTCAVQLCG